MSTTDTTESKNSCIGVCGHVYFVSYFWPTREVYKVLERWIKDDEDWINMSYASSYETDDPDILLEAYAHAMDIHPDYTKEVSDWNLWYCQVQESDESLLGPWMFVNAIIEGREVSGFIKRNTTGTITIIMMRGIDEYHMEELK